MTTATLRGSLRIRLLAGTLVWIAASILIAGWGLGNLFRQHVAAQFHTELNTHLDQLTAQLQLDAQGRPELALPLSDPRLSKPFSGLYWQIERITDGDKVVAKVVLRSRSLWDEVLMAPQDVPADGELHRHRVPGPGATQVGMIERVVDVDGSRLRLLIAADESLMVEPVAHFQGMLWLALGLLGLGLALAALVQVFVGLAPLNRLRDGLARIRNAESQHLEGAYPAEIMPLVNEFNSVLMHNDEVVKRARTHAGNLAHALKTPLSVLANAADGQDDELARQVRFQVDMARKQVNYHLTRAQAAASRRPGMLTPLRPVIEGLVRTLQRIYQERGLDIVLPAMPAGLSFRGEEQDLQEMLGNLLENACKWTSRRIEISVLPESDLLRIVFDDDGPGVAVDQREAVLRRGARADQLVPGAGLGLAIVDDLSHMYGGDVLLEDSPLGGARAVLRLPANASDCRWLPA